MLRESPDANFRMRSSYRTPHEHLMEERLDLLEHNRRAWNRLSNDGILWSQPVSSELIEEARQGRWDLFLAGGTVPRSWLGDVAGKDILCLASGGGQQAPLLAAAGAHVTSFDISDAQLAKDKLVAERENLTIRIEQGSMTDLSRFDSGKFDLIFLPVSVNAVPDVQPVWRECCRVLRARGVLLAGFINPLVYLFQENDGSSPNQGLTVINRLPYAEYESFTEEERRSTVEAQSVFLWSHSLESLIGGQLAAGFVLTDFQESYRTDDRAPIINAYCPTYFATRAVKAYREP